MIAVLVCPFFITPPPPFSKRPLCNIFAELLVYILLPLPLPLPLHDEVTTRTTINLSILASPLSLPLVQMLLYINKRREHMIGGGGGLVISVDSPCRDL